MKTIHYLTVSAIVLIITAFYGGMQFSNASRNPAGGGGNYAGMSGNFNGVARDSTARNFAGGRTRPMNGVQGGTAGGESMIRGEILSVDENSITVNTPANGSKIVLFSDKTEITETVSVTRENLTDGKGVMITGETNEDGTVSASAIMIREVMRGGMDAHP
jgi:hypothetical protein